MARDCPDRQRGASWRNDGPGAPRTAGRIGSTGGGDAVDREYEVCFSNFDFPLKNSLLTYTSNSCKNSAVPALLLLVSKLVLVPSTMVPPVPAVMPSHGNAGLLADLLPGVLATRIGITMALTALLVVLPADPLVAQLLGLVTVASADMMTAIAIEETATTVVIVGTTTILPEAHREVVAAAVLPLGINLLPEPRLLRRSLWLRPILVLMVVIPAMVLLPVWALPRLLDCLLRLPELLPASLDRSMPSSSNMLTQRLFLPRPLRQMRHPRRLPWISLPLPLPVLRGC